MGRQESSRWSPGERFEGTAVSYTQILCGSVNLYEKDESGHDVLKSHRLQLREGVCVHTDKLKWREVVEELNAEISGQYVGMIGPDRDDHWPVHVWLSGSAHGIRVEPKPQDLSPESPEQAEARRIALDSVSGYVPELPAPAPMPSDAYSRIQEEEWEEHPSPEHTTEMPFPEDFKIPDPVLKLKAAAIGSGWSVAITYARGHGTHATHGRPTALARSLAVRIAGHESSARRAVAVYVKPASGGTWTWKTIYVWGPDLSPLKLGREILDTFLLDPQGSEEKLRKWAGERAEAVEAKKVADKAKRKDGTAKRTVRESGG